MIEENCRSYERTVDVHSVFFPSSFTGNEHKQDGKGGKISIPFVILRSDSPLCFGIKAN